MKYILIGVYCTMATAASGDDPGRRGPEGAGRIRPFQENPFYWEYRGAPTLLLGGSDHHNLFNQPELGGEPLETHLDRLAEAGGNYVRNTMSDREGLAVRAFAKSDEGKFDLGRWNGEYWDRFDRFLRQTLERGIIVQIEIWDPWDFKPELWAEHAFNPANNVNFDDVDSGLPTRVEGRPTDKPSGLAFFRTVPALDDNELVRSYQEAFVDEILSHSLRHPHVLYSIHNEIGEPLEWGDYWAKFIRDRAAREGLEAQVTDMRRSNDVNGDQHRHIQRRPDLYSFIEASQNNGGSSPGLWRDPESRHWAPLIELREFLEQNGLSRPINNTKIYGHISGDGWGGADQGVQKFWRNLFAGCASARFHRPPSGLGLSGLAESHIRSARMFSEAFDFARSRPDGRHELLRDRAPNEAYLQRVDGEQFAVYFPDGGRVTLDLSDASGRFALRWLDAGRGSGRDGESVEGGGPAQLEPPGDGHWIALLRRK